jgi:hypothetical protein
MNDVRLVRAWRCGISAAAAHRATFVRSLATFHIPGRREREKSEVVALGQCALNLCVSKRDLRLIKS